MKKQFEYKPFDRVTVEIDCEIKHADTQRKAFIKRLFPAVLSGTSPIDGSFVSGAYIRAGRSFTTFTCDVERIKPGNYDADGNWLPQPGEPCHIILDNDSAKNMVVVSAEAYHVAAIGEYDTEKTVFFKKPLGFVDADFDIDECGGIPQSAILLPGRIKTSQQ